MLASLEETIGDYVVNTTYENLPPEVIEVTKKQILDFFAVSMAGYDAPGVKELRELYESLGGTAESTILGSLAKVPAINAAQVNASMAHALDFDDVHEYAIVHPGVITIPVALAIAEKIGKVNGRDFITAVAIGVDLACRFALAPVPGRKPHIGWHLTSVFGYLVSAVVTAKLLSLSKAQILNAMGIAYHQAAGNGQSVKDGALTKRLGPGFAVRGGMISALLAERGVTGTKNFISGEWGIYNLYFKGDYDVAVLVDKLGEDFLNKDVVFKPYPCCRGIHPAIDAALNILKENPSLETDKIEKVILEVSESHYQLLCSPEEFKRFPRNIVDAQFSIPWGVAVALSKKQVSLDYLKEETLKDPAILGITSKMEIKVNPKLNRRSCESIEPTIVVIKTKDGRSYTALEENPLGSIKRPMEWEDCIRKFRNCVPYLPDFSLHDLILRIKQLEVINDVKDLFTSLVELDKVKHQDIPSVC